MASAIETVVIKRNFVKFGKPGKYKGTDHLTNQMKSHRKQPAAFWEMYPDLSHRYAKKVRGKYEKRKGKM